MASIRKLLSDSVVYGLSSIVGRFLNYLLVPLYTYHISAASGGYGVVTNIYAYTALLLVILTFGMETTFFYFANRQGADGRRDVRPVFTVALGAVGAVAALFVVLVFLFLRPVASAMGYGAHPSYIAAMAVVVALDAFQAILFARLRFDRKAWKFAALKLAFIFLNIGLNLFVFLLAPRLQHLPFMQWYDEHNNVGYIFYINLVSTSLVTFGFWRELRDFRPAAFSLPLLRQMLRYAWPLLLFGIVGILNQVADKILFHFLYPYDDMQQQLGIYGACVKIAMIMAIITQAFRYAYEPFVFASGRDDKSRETQALVMKYFVMFTLLAFMVVVCYMDLFKYVIKSDYWEGLRAVPIVMMAEIFMGVYFNLSFWYKLTAQTWWGAVISAVGCVALLAVNVFLVPRIGYLACAWGGLAGYGVCMLLSYFLGQRHYRVPYPVGAIAFWFALAMALFAACRLVSIDNLWLRLAYRSLLLALYVAALLWSERALLRRALAKVLRRR
ncbi:MAG: lipopolysaccharide biosynthesis protein [Bacteroidales bacterium]|nr:lipopolysaccharide biosynthesis protein [Bacteroidales bacterium]